MMEYKQDQILLQQAKCIGKRVKKYIENIPPLNSPGVNKLCIIGNIKNIDKATIVINDSRQLNFNNFFNYNEKFYGGIEEEAINTIIQELKNVNGLANKFNINTCSSGEFHIYIKLGKE